MRRSRAIALAALGAAIVALAAYALALRPLLASRLPAFAGWEFAGAGALAGLALALATLLPRFPREPAPIERGALHVQRRDPVVDPDFALALAARAPQGRKARRIRR